MVFYFVYNRYEKAAVYHCTIKLFNGLRLSSRDETAKRL